MHICAELASAKLYSRLTYFDDCLVSLSFTLTWDLLHIRTKFAIFDIQNGNRCLRSEKPQHARIEDDLLWWIGMAMEGMDKQAHLGETVGGGWNWGSLRTLRHLKVEELVSQAPDTTTEWLEGQVHKWGVCTIHLHNGDRNYDLWNTYVSILRFYFIVGD